METAFKITALDNKDINQIIDLILPIQQIEHGVPVTIADQPDLLDIEKNYQQKGGGFWGINHNGQIIGTIALIKMTEGQGGVIRKMFVKKEFRGKEFGLAQKLLEHLIMYANDIDLTALYLGTVHILRAAIRFYERNQFLPISKEYLPPNFPLMEVDDTFYYLKLNTKTCLM